MTDIILHHYDASPFSEKVRLMLGLKGVAWRSVVTPDRMPKPDLTPLTGGYRRAPVMQVGADTYCDSQLILHELERRFPEPRADRGMSWAVNLWADRLWFQPSVAAIFGRIGDRIDPAFVADREKLSGRPFDTAAMAAAAGPAMGQWRAMAGWVEEALDGQDWLGGEGPAIADLAAYMNVWFVANVFPDMADALTAGMPRLRAWRERVRAIGHGERSELSGAEALAVAREAEPAHAPAHDPAQAPGLSPGDAVTVAADDYGRDPIAGTLVAANARSATVARDGEGVGRVHVHVPSAGFWLRGA